MSSSPTRSRNALGMPSGSVRALLSLMVLALSWMLVLFAIKPEEKGTFRVPLVFIYLQFLMILIIGHYFTSRMTPVQEGDHAALWLPRGTVRFLILLTYGGLAYFLWTRGSEYTYDFKMEGDQILLIGLMFAGFILGHYFTLIALWWMRPIGEVPGWVLDVQAWFAILAMVGLVIVFLVHVVINPSVGPERQLSTAGLEAGLAAIVGFYFGARS